MFFSVSFVPTSSGKYGFFSADWLRVQSWCWKRDRLWNILCYSWSWSFEGKPKIYICKKVSIIMENFLNLNFCERILSQNLFPVSEIRGSSKIKGIGKNFIFVICIIYNWALNKLYLKWRCNKLKLYWNWNYIHHNFQKHFSFENKPWDLNSTPKRAS